MKKQIKPWVSVTILVIIFLIAAGLVYYNLAREAVRFDTEAAVKAPVEVVDELDSAEKEVKKFTIQYLDAYKDIKTKKNYEEVIEFISDSAFAQMMREETPFDENAVDFDDYEILGIEKSNHEVYAPLVSGYVVKVKLLKDNKALLGIDGQEAVKISVIKEEDSWRTPSWNFILK